MFLKLRVNTEIKFHIGIQKRRTKHEDLDPHSIYFGNHCAVPFHKMRYPSEKAVKKEDDENDWCFKCKMAELSKFSKNLINRGLVKVKSKGQEIE